MKYQLTVICESAAEVSAAIAKLEGAAPAVAASTPAPEGNKGPGRPAGSKNKKPAGETTQAASAPPAADTKPASDGAAVTSDTVRTRLNAVVEKKGAAAAKKILSAYSKSISELKTEDYAKVMADIAELLGDAPASTETADDDFLN
jgi:hypothetical protein